MLCGLLLMMTHEAVYAEVAEAPTAKSSKLTVQKIPVYKLCPDLKADLTLTKGDNGMVTISGRVSNVGKGNCNIASVAEVIMNLAYAPKYSYNMTGVSVVLATETVTALYEGASFTVNTTYQIPDFDGWATGSVQGNAKRLFTLRIIQEDRSPYKTGEDCNVENKTASGEVAYRDAQH